MKSLADLYKKMNKNEENQSVINTPPIILQKYDKPHSLSTTPSKLNL